MNGNGLLQECERICNLNAAGITGNAQKILDFTARLNNAQDRFYALAFQYDTLWNFDDRNHTDGVDPDMPIGTTDIVSGVADYLFDEELLQVTQVFAKDTSGNFFELTPQDDKNTPSAYLTQVSGIPAKYELVGNSIILDKLPNYNSDEGLKVIYKRRGVQFTPVASSQPCGIPTLFHSYLAREASYPYLIEKGLKHSGLVKQEIMKDEMALKTFISTRAKPRRAGLRTVVEDNR